MQEDVQTSDRDTGRIDRMPGHPQRCFCQQKEREKSRNLGADGCVRALEAIGNEGHAAHGAVVVCACVHKVVLEFYTVVACVGGALRGIRRNRFACSWGGEVGTFL